MVFVGLQKIFDLKVYPHVDIQALTTNQHLSVSDKVRTVMLHASTPLHYFDVDELLHSFFGARHSSYTHLRSNKEYIQLFPAIYIHRSNATPEFYEQFNGTLLEIVAKITEIVEYAKIPIPSKCLAALFTSDNLILQLTNRAIRSIISKLTEQHQYLYKTSGSAIASKHVLYHLDSFNSTSKFLCKDCGLEVRVPILDLLTDNFRSTLQCSSNCTTVTPPTVTSTPAIADSTVKNNIIFEDQNCGLSKPLEEYDDLDEAMIDTFFIQVLNSADPSELIPHNLFENWKATIESTEYKSAFISDIASRIGISWPTTRHEEKLDDFLKYDIHSLGNLPGFGSKKTRTLILCFAYAAYNADKSKFTTFARNDHMGANEISSTLSLDDLLNSGRPASKISPELWEHWCKSIDQSNNASMRIAEIAHKYHLSWPYTKREETLSEYIKLPLNMILTLPGFGIKKIRTLILCVASLGLAPSKAWNQDDVLSQTAETASDSSLIELDTLVQKIQEILSCLPSRELTIIQKRFGINCETSFTLEEISAQSGVTRERVRQIVRGVTEKIRYTETGRLLSEFISRLDIEPIWSKLSNDYGIISKSQLGRNFQKSCNSEFLFALECCGMTLQSWLSSVANEDEFSWYRSGYLQNHLESLTHRAQEFLRQTDTPLPLSTISHHLSISLQDTGALVSLLPELRILDGYVFEGRISPRARRTARLHRLLCTEDSHLSLRDLVCKSACKNDPPIA